MGVIRGKHDPDFTYFSFVSILGIYRLVSFCLLCCYIPPTVEIPRLSRTRQGSGDWPVHLVALATASACAFYTRQLYLFVPVLAAWVVLTRTKTSPFLVLAFF